MFGVMLKTRPPAKIPQGQGAPEGMFNITRIWRSQKIMVTVTQITLLK